MVPRRRKAGGVVLLLLAILALLTGLHYLPYYNAARSALDGARQLAAEANTLQVGDVNRATLDRIQGEVDALQANMRATQSLLATDPWVELARLVPPAGRQLSAADRVLDAAGHLVDASDVALSLGDGFVSAREGPSDQLLGNLVKLVATSSGDVANLKDDLDAADTSLATARQTASGPLLEATDSMTGAIDRLRPLIDEYDAAGALIPSLLGWGGQRRYLVLAEDPAELRPGGGYTGTYGIVTFKNGQLAGMDFHDIYTLDGRGHLPFVEPPEALQNHLLGDASWQLADANWSPDWPTAAQDADRLYAGESKDTDISGVIALTTYALDGILKVIGPVDVPDYGVTVNPGEVTLTALEQTRGTNVPTNRKAFLDSLATAVLARLQSLPSDEWVPMAQAIQGLAAQRLIMVWSADPSVEATIASGPLGGAIRQDAGDYLAVSEANVAPTSKFNLVVRRSSQLSVTIGADGSLADSLELTWANDAGNPGEPYGTLRADSVSQDGFYGAYVRVLVPSGSQVTDASGNAGGPISGIESIDPVAGRDAIGNYLLMAPGASSLSYSWVPSVSATQSGGLWTYDLTIQKQPGALAEPLSVHITLPPGATIVTTPADSTDTLDGVTFTTSFVQDVQLSLQYRLP